jgi:hypothetical protein
VVRRRPERGLPDVTFEEKLARQGESATREAKLLFLTRYDAMAKAIEHQASYQTPLAAAPAASSQRHP